MLKLIFRILLPVLILGYVVTGVFMVRRKLQYHAEVEDDLRKEIEGKFLIWYLANIAVSLVVIWHLQPIITPQHHGGWFVLNAFVAWVCTTLSWGIGICDTKWFVPMKIASLVILYGSCFSVPFAQIGISVLTIVWGICFFHTHRELWTVASVVIVFGVFTLLRKMTIPGAGAIIMLVVELAGVIYFGIALLHSKKWGKVICAIIILVLLYKVFNNAQNLYYLYFFRG